MAEKYIKNIVTAVIIAACVGLAYLFPATGFMAFVVGMVFGFPVAVAGYLLYCRKAIN